MQEQKIQALFANKIDERSNTELAPISEDYEDIDLNSGFPRIGSGVSFGANGAMKSPKPDMNNKVGRGMRHK